VSEPGFLAVCAAVLVVAILYSSVGHAGASGYIAVMTLAGFAPEVIRPAALVMNIAVASITATQFARARHFSWSLLWPFALLAVPLAFVGGRMALPTPVFKLLVGGVLLASAARLLAKPGADAETRSPARGVAVGVGGVLGLLAGLTGTGGGIFLTPVLLFMRWAQTKQAAAVSAVFILVNSLAGLAGSLSADRAIPAVTWPLVAAALVGGAVGSYLGSQRLDVTVIKRLLAIVLVVAGLKLVFA